MIDEVMSEVPNGPSGVWYAPVFEWQGMRFAWFERALVAESREGAKAVGLKLEQGYIEKDIPIKACHTVARFATEGNYAIAQLGPQDEERPVILVNPSPEAVEAMTDPVAEGNGAALPEPIEETPYDLIHDDGLIKSVSF